MHEVYEENLRLEHEMTELLGELQRAAQADLFLPGWRRFIPLWSGSMPVGLGISGVEAVEASRLIGLWYFQEENTLASGRSSFAGYILTAILQELGQLELLAAGYLNHRERPVKPRPA